MKYTDWRCVPVLWVLIFFWAIVRVAVRYLWPSIEQRLANAARRLRNLAHENKHPLDFTDVRSIVCDDCGRLKTYDEIYIPDPDDDVLPIVKDIPQRKTCIACVKRREPVRSWWKIIDLGEHTGSDVRTAELARMIEDERKGK